jgi:transposase
MHAINFTPEDVQTIAWERYHHPDPRVAKRMEILWLKHVEMTHEKIAEIAGVCRSTVQRLLNLYRLSGIEAVRQFHEQGPKSSFTEHTDCLSEEFRLRPPTSTAEAAQRIETITGIRRKPTQVRRFLRETLGLKWRKTASVPLPPNRTLEEHVQTQEAFLK